jgi:outer membrane protein assembly factor BamB
VWSYQKGGSSPAISDGRVFTIGSGKVYAFGSSIQDWTQFHYDAANTGNSPTGAPDTNHTKWISEDIGAVTGSQAMIVGDQVFVYANDEVYGISRETGTTSWNTSIPGDTQAYGSWASPAYNDGVLFVSAGYNLTRIDAEAGTVLQQIAFPDGGYSCNDGPTVADGRVFAGSGGANYYAFDENDLDTVIWTYTVPTWGAVSTPAVADGKVVVGECAWSGASTISCVNENTGANIWTTQLVGDVGGSAAIDATNDRVYVATFVNYTNNLGRLYALDFTTGAEVWNQTIAYSDSTPVVSGERIYVSGSVNAPGVTYCFNSAGVLQWEVSCGSWTVSPTVADGKLFTGDIAPWGTGDGINVYDATTGALVWQYDHAGSSPSVAEDADGCGIVVSIGTDGMVYAFGGDGAADDLDWTQFHYDIANTGNSPADAPDTNQVKWISENISAAECSQAIIVGDQVFAYISAAGADDAIYALNRATGSVEWSATFPGETKDWGSSTTPAYADGVIFAAAGYNVTGFDAATGTKLQEIAFPDGGYLSNGGATVADGMVFVGSGDGANYYAFDASDLTDVVWNYTPALSRAYSTPAVADDRVIFGDAGWGYDDGYLYCVNEFTGTEVWSTNLTGLVWGSATIDAANNRVYVATAVDWTYDEGKLYALTFDTGAVQWSADINYTSSTPAVSGGYIYVAASGAAPGVTYCFNSAGVEQWNVPTGSRKISPAVADGKLFTGNVGLSGMASEGTEGINVYDATTGALVWQHEHAGSSPSVAEDADGCGMVVSIGADGMVYAFGGEEMMGDVNNDGEVTTADAALALRMAVGAVPTNDAADVNRDGAVTSLDALMILQAVAGAITI